MSAVSETKPKHSCIWQQRNSLNSEQNFWQIIVQEFAKKDVESVRGFCKQYIELKQWDFLKGLCLLTPHWLESYSLLMLTYHFILTLTAQKSTFILPKNKLRSDQLSPDCKFKSLLMKAQCLHVILNHLAQYTYQHKNSCIYVAKIWAYKN